MTLRIQFLKCLNLLFMNVSLFKNIKYFIGDCTLEEVVHRIKSGETQEQILALRQLKAESKEEEYGIAKKNLVSFTASGTFTNGRKVTDLVAYNGNIVIDVDKLSPVLLKQCEHIAKLNSYTHACFISPGGDGLKIIVRTNGTKETHKDVFNALKNYIEELLNVFIDESGSDISRLCLFSFDTSASYNPDSIIFDPLNLINMNNQKEITHPEALFEHCKRYTNKKHTYAEGTRNNYIHALACNCNRRGLSEEQCLGFTMAEFDLPKDEIKSAVNSAYKNISDHNTDETKTKKEKISNINKIESFLLEKYEFRFNVAMGTIEYKLHSDILFQTMRDYTENSMFREILKAGIKCNISNLRSILGSDFCPIYDPFVEYFNALPAWDGETDYISMLSETIKTTKKEEWEICFRKWIVAYVGCIIKTETINHTAIVFAGKQGIGKTTWLEKLVPVALKSHLFSGTINPENKDALIHLSECILINLDELENLNKTEIGSLKSLITLPSVKIRRPYMRNNELSPRRASFCGSVNNMQFLNDPTGSRRFLCFEVLEIEYQHSIEIDKVLAQAISLFHSGFKFWFTQEEIKRINKNNEEFQMRSIEEELLLTNFEHPNHKSTNMLYLTATDIAAKLSLNTKMNLSNASAISIGKILNKYKFNRVKKGGIYVYEVCSIDFEKIDRNTREAPSDPELSELELNVPPDSNLPF